MGADHFPPSASTWSDASFYHCNWNVQNKWFLELHSTRSATAILGSIGYHNVPIRSTLKSLLAPGTPNMDTMVFCLVLPADKNVNGSNQQPEKCQRKHLLSAYRVLTHHLLDPSGITMLISKCNRLKIWIHFEEQHVCCLRDKHWEVTGAVINCVYVLI